MKIIIDEREIKLYEKFLLMDNVDSIVKEVLPIGDIIIQTDKGIEVCIIERKSLSDLLSSIKDGRYEEQSYRLINASGHHRHNIIYIIEGMMSTIRCEKEKTLIYSSITSLSFYKGFTVLRTCNIQETADLIRGITLKIDKNNLQDIPFYYSIVTECETKNEVKDEITESITPSSYVSVVKKVKKENVTIENIGEIMLCQVPGISTTISKVIITKYKTIKGLLQSLEDDPTCLDGLSYDLKGKSRKINSTAMKNIKKYLSC